MSPTVKALIAVFIVAGVLGFGWWRYSDFLNQGKKAPVSAQILNKLEKEGFPDFELTEIITKKTYRLSDFKDKLVILNFWASWCDPCIAEFPSLYQLLSKYPNDLVLLAVSADFEEADIHNFLKTFKYTGKNIHVFWDKDYVLAKQFGTEKLPESYIIAKDRTLIRKVSGVDDWSTPDAMEYFQHLIEQSKQ